MLDKLKKACTRKEVLSWAYDKFVAGSQRHNFLSGHAKIAWTDNS